MRGSGVPQTEAAYHLSGGVIPGRVPFGKFLTGGALHRSGHSMGREGPSVQIGAGLASVIGRWLPLSPQRVQDLGAGRRRGRAGGRLQYAGGGGVVRPGRNHRRHERDTARFDGRRVGRRGNRRAIDSRQRTAVSRAHLRLLHPAELLAYAALGIVGGVVSLLFCKALLRLRGVVSSPAALDEEPSSRPSAVS